MTESTTPEAVSTRDRILNVAASLFYKKGVYAVGINEIVATASASKLSLYRYFPSKEHLVRDMLVAHSDRIHAWLKRATDAAPPGPERVLVVFDLLMDWFVEPDYGGCAVINTVTDTRTDPAIAAIARNHLARYRALLEELLRDSKIADPPILARQLLFLIEGASVVATIDNTPSVGEEARAAAAHLLNLPGYRSEESTSHDNGISSSLSRTAGSPEILSASHCLGNGVTAPKGVPNDVSGRPIWPVVHGDCHAVSRRR